MRQDGVDAALQDHHGGSGLSRADGDQPHGADGGDGAGAAPGLHDAAVHGDGTRLSPGAGLRADRRSVQSAALVPDAAEQHAGADVAAAGEPADRARELTTRLDAVSPPYSLRSHFARMGP